MPKRGFLATAQRVTLQAKPSALKNRFTVNKILPEPCIKGIQIPIQINFELYTIRSQFQSLATHALNKPCGFHHRFHADGGYVCMIVNKL